MSNSTKSTIIIATILLLFAIAAFAFMAHQVSKQGASLTQQINTLSAHQAQEASYAKLQRIAQDSQTERQELASRFLLQESDSIDFLNKVEVLAQQAGVVLVVESLDLVSGSGENTNWIETELTFNGSRDRVLRFIKILETVQYVSRLTEVDLNAKAANDWSASVTMRVRLLNYE